MAHGWKRIKPVKNNAQAITELSNAFLLVSEAMSHLHAVVYGNVDIDGSEYNAARKLYDLARIYQNEYNKYQMGETK